MLWRQLNLEILICAFLNWEWELGLLVEAQPGAIIDEQECVTTIQKAVKSGLNLLDTAPAYNFGNSEKIVGKALEGLERKDVCLITKCGIVWTREGSLFNKVGDVQLYKNLSAESIRMEIEDSLKRLRTDYLDIYMTHWQSVEPCFTPIAETMDVLNDLKVKGKIKAIGAANVLENISKNMSNMVRLI